MPPPPTIAAIRPEDAPALRALIRGVWQEFHDPGDPDDEPDLREPIMAYGKAASALWVAHAPAHTPASVPDPGPALIGSLALLDLGLGVAALKRMYVHPTFRGPAHGTATLLLQAALVHARAHHLHTLVLGTMDVFTRSHRFYARHGFRPIAREALPPNFPLDPADTLFFALDLA